MLKTLLLSCGALLILLWGTAPVSSSPSGSSEKTVSFEEAPRLSSDDSSTPQSYQESTPVRAPNESQNSLFSTPGKAISLRQAELTKERFVEVLGEEIVREWYVNWEILNDSELSFEAPSKRPILPLLMEKMKQLRKKQSERSSLFSDLFHELSDLKVDTEGVHIDRMEDVVQGYFRTLSPGSTVTFSLKNGGVQLGMVAHVSLPTRTMEIQKFYIKTHGKGRLISKSSAPKTVDPKELLLYKILERLGMGCETHFLARSSEDVYIATLDAGHGGQFFSFSKAKEDEEEIGRSFWGCLSVIPKSPREEAAQEAIEYEVSQDPIAQHFIQEVSSLDALSRLLHLDDLFNNPDNFGFFRSREGGFALRAIDFRISSTDNLRMTYRGWEGFLEGNGDYDYAGCHKAIRYSLHYRALPQRIQTVRALFTEGGPLFHLGDAIDRSYQSVLVYLEANAEFSQEREDLVEILKNYRDTLQHNVGFFTYELNAWRA